MDSRSLKSHLNAGTAKGLYFEAYFHLLERVGREAEGLLGRRLTGSEVLLIANRIESYLRGKVFGTSRKKQVRN